MASWNAGVDLNQLWMLERWTPAEAAAAEMEDPAARAAATAC
jgi:hypothetical protein